MALSPQSRERQKTWEEGAGLVPFCPSRSFVMVEELLDIVVVVDENYHRNTEVPLSISPVHTKNEAMIEYCSL